MPLALQNNPRLFSSNLFMFVKAIFYNILWFPLLHLFLFDTSPTPGTMSCVTQAEVDVKAQNEAGVDDVGGKFFMHRVSS
jgi:hypothetical protein